jgi:hypothetical protein
MIFLEKRLAFVVSGDVAPDQLVQASDHNNMRADLLADHHADALGTKISNASISATANIEAKKVLFQSVSVPLEYFLDSANVTDAQTFAVRMIADGYLVGATAQYSDAISAGSIAIDIAKNGTKLVTTDLNMVLNNSSNSDYAKIAYATSGFSFVAGNTVSAFITSTTLAPLTGTIKITLYYHLT